MADEPDNLVPVMLRRLDGKVDRMSEDVREMKSRLTNVEFVVAALVPLTAACSKPSTACPIGSIASSGGWTSRRMRHRFRSELNIRNCGFFISQARRDDVDT